MDEQRAPPMTDAPIHLGHAYLLLTHDEGTGRWLCNPTAGFAGYAAAMVLHWSFAERLIAVGADRFMVQPFPSRWPSERAALDCIPDRPVSLYKLITSVYGILVTRRVEPALHELVELGALRRRRDHLLGVVPWHIRWPEADGSLEQRIRRDLAAHLAAPGDAPHALDGLLGILRAVGALEAVLGEGLDRARVDPLTERVPIGRDLYAFVDELYATYGR